MKLKVDHPISQWPHVELTNCATAMPSYALPCCLKYCNCTSCLQMIPNNTLNWLRHQFKPFDTPVPRYCKGCKRSSCFKFGEWSSYQRNTIDQFCDSEVTHMGQGISHPLSSLLTAFRWDFTSSIPNHLITKNLKHAKPEVSTWRDKTTCQINGDLSCTVKRLQRWEA